MLLQALSDPLTFVLLCLDETRRFFFFFLLRYLFAFGTGLVSPVVVSRVLESHRKVFD